MDVLLNVILPVFLAAGAAALVQPTLKLDERALSRVTFYIFSPALAFHALATSGVSGVTLILWAIGAMIAPALKLEGGTHGAFLVGLVLMNTLPVLYTAVAGLLVNLTGVMTLVLTMEYDADPEFAALSVFITTIASLLTVTVILNLLI